MKRTLSAIRNFLPVLLLAIPLLGMGPAGAKLTGKIEVLPAGGAAGAWTVSGKTVNVTADTKINTQSGAAIVGACVDVRGEAGNAGAINAMEISTRPAGRCADPTPIGSVEIFGSVEQIPAGGAVGDWKIAGKTIRVTPETKLEQRGGPAAIGSCAEVRGVENPDGSLTASKLEIRSGIEGCAAPGGGGSGNGGGNGRGGRVRAPLEFRGVVQEAPAAGSGDWVIAGRTVAVTEATTVLPPGRPLEVGSCASVQGMLETDLTVTATRVQRIGDGVCDKGLEAQSDLSFAGVVEVLPAGGAAGNWTVGGSVFSVPDTARILPTSAQIAVGDCVLIRGEFGTGTTLIATRIDKRPASYCAPGSGGAGIPAGGAGPKGVHRITGAIEVLPAGGAAGEWTVAGRKVTVTAQTVLDVSKGAAVMGACVQAIGTKDATGLFTATRIRVLSASGSCTYDGGVTDAASLAAFGVSPGQLISLFGRNIGPAVNQPMIIEDGKVSSRVANTTVLFDGTPAAVLFASGGQINAIVPCDVAGKTTVEVQVESNGAWTNTQTLDVFPTFPSLFTLSNSGTGRGAILNADGSVNSPSNGTARGEVAMLYGSGAGQTNPACADGAITPEAGPYPVPVAPVSVEVGGKAAAVEFAGGAPGLVRGVIQINVKLAADTPTGPNVPVVVKIGDGVSQSGVTMAVK